MPDMAQEDSMEIRMGTAAFPQHSGSGPQTEKAVVTFSGTIVAAVAVITGWDVKFSPVDGDHHLGRLDVAVNTLETIGRSVEVIITFGLRDWSGNWDDRYEGKINFAVLAETA
jgi:hypothetical protein